jgi:hypothetical protein
VGYFSKKKNKICCMLIREFRVPHFVHVVIELPQLQKFVFILTGSRRTILWLQPWWICSKSTRICSTCQSSKLHCLIWGLPIFWHFGGHFLTYICMETRDNLVVHGSIIQNFQSLGHIYSSPPVYIVLMLYFICQHNKFSNSNSLYIIREHPCST